MALPPRSVLTLRGPGGADVHVVVLGTGTRAGMPSATFEIDGETWARVEAGGLLHTDPGRRRGPGRGLDPARPIEVEAVLDPVVALDVADRLAVNLASAEPSDPLLATEAWWALSATQDVALPPDLAATGSLQEGIGYEHPGWLVDAGSVGLDEAWERAMEIGGTEPLLSLVQELFEEQDWVVERPEADATVLRIPVAGDAGDFELWVRTDEVEQLVTVYAVLPTDVPAPRVAEVLELAARLNQSVPVGSYEADPESGLLSFKTAIDVAGDRLSPALVERLVATAMAAATRGHAALDGLLADQ